MQSKIHELHDTVTLENPFTTEQIARFAGIRKRTRLLQDELYTERRSELEQLLSGVEFQQAPQSQTERRSVRVVAWNIQRGAQLERIKAYLAQHHELSEAEIYLLNEVDIGMARSGNLNIARELADHLGAGYLYGNSYLCLDHGDSRDRRLDIPNAESLHGNAIISRLPLRRGENFSVAITKDKFHSSEKRLGHKKALWAEVETPLGPLAVVCVHLDSIAAPEQRRAQMRDVLRKIEQRRLERVLIGGDFNTSTYDVKSIPRLLKNLSLKMLRGGFPHGMHHYLHPQSLYERGIFEELQQHGFSWEPLNRMAVGTSCYEVGTHESESKVSDHLPGIAVKILRWKLRPWNGVAMLKLDWFAGRGVSPASDGGLPPTVMHKPSWDGLLLSDHDPIVVEISW